MKILISGAAFTLNALEETDSMNPLKSSRKFGKAAAWIALFLVLGGGGGATYLALRSRESAVEPKPLAAEKTAVAGPLEMLDFAVTWETDQVPEPIETDAGCLSFRKNKADEWELLVNGVGTRVAAYNVKVHLTAQLEQERVLVVVISDDQGSAVMDSRKQALLVSLGAAGTRTLILSDGPIHDILMFLGSDQPGLWKVVPGGLEAEFTLRGTLVYRAGQLSARLLPEYQGFVERKRALDELVATAQKGTPQSMPLGAEFTRLTGRLERQPIAPGYPELDSDHNCRSYVLVFPAPLTLTSQDMESTITCYTFLGDPKQFDPLVGRSDVAIEAHLGFNGRGSLLGPEEPHKLSH